jgi:predicted RNA-binding protein YlxR (DUF448 family)
VACRVRRDDTGMVRAGRDADAGWYLGRGTGRGVWCCREFACAKALRVSHVARALRTGVNQGDLESLLGLYNASSDLGASVGVEE